MNRRGSISAVRWWHRLPRETSIDAVVKGVSLSSESADIDHGLREGLQFQTIAAAAQGCDVIVGATALQIAAPFLAERITPLLPGGRDIIRIVSA